MVVVGPGGRGRSVRPGVSLDLPPYGRIYYSLKLEAGRRRRRRRRPPSREHFPARVPGSWWDMPPQYPPKSTQFAEMVFTKTHQFWDGVFLKKMDLTALAVKKKKVS